MVPESRRSYLALLGTVAVAGCIGRPTPEPSGEAGTTTATPEQPPIDTPTPSGPPTGPVQCTGDPVSVERSVNDEPGYGDEMEYFPSNRTVRIVTVRSGDEPRGFAEWSFEEWATVETADVSRPRAVGATADRLGTDEFGSGVGRPPDAAATADVVVWLHLTSRVEDGEVVATPTTSLNRLVQHAPRSVNATVSLEGDTFSRSVPVWADHSRVGFGGG